MKKLLVLTLLVSILGTTATGCIFGCGAAPYDGGGQVFEDGGDAGHDAAPATTDDASTQPDADSDGGVR